MSIVEAAASDNRLQLLLAMRTRIATSMDDPDCPQRDLSSLSRRLLDIAKEIDEIKERAEQEAVRNGSGSGKKWNPASV